MSFSILLKLTNLSIIQAKVFFISFISIVGFGWMNYVYSKINLKLNKDDLSKWAREVKKRDKKCFCGSTKKLEAHHLFDKSSFPFLAFTKANGVAMCKKHHRDFHKNYMGGYQKTTTPLNYILYKLKVKLRLWRAKKWQ